MKKRKTIIEKTAWMIAILLGSAHFGSSGIALPGNAQQAVIEMISDSYGKLSETMFILILKN